MRAQFNNVYIRAIAACSGKTLHNVAKTCQSFLDEKHAARLVKTLGFENVREVPLTMTTADMCVEIAKDVITRCNIDKDSIDALIFVTQTNDSVAPASVFVMQDKLGLSANCYLNNITNGCAGSVHGIFEGACLINAGVAKRVLVCFGDTYCKVKDIEDSDQKANAALFGDGAGVVLLEKQENCAPIYFNVQAHGNLHKVIHDTKHSDRVERLKKAAAQGLVDESALLPYQTKGIQIEGTAIASYAIDNVIPNVNDLLSLANLTKDDVALFLLHQANKTILKAVALSMDVPQEKIPFVAQNTGNTSSASLALAICESHEVTNRLKDGLTVLSAFGVGMNVASMLCDLSKTTVLEAKYF